MNSDKAYDLITQIAKTRARSTKLNILRKNPNLRGYLLYAYNPFYNYHIRNIQPKEYINVHGKYPFTELTWRLLDVLRNGHLRGNKARNAVISHLRTLTPASATLFHWILKKDLRCGIGPKIINTVFPDWIPIFSVMLAEDFDPNRLTLPCYVSFKLDGLRGIYRNGTIVSRTGKTIVGLGHIIAGLNTNIIKHFDGELVIPGEHFQDISGDVRNLSDSKRVEYHIFDCPGLGEYPFFHRYGFLKDYLHTSKAVRLVAHHKVDTLDGVMWFYNQAVALGYEGIMVKSERHKYQDKRCYDWMKIVAEIKEDLHCVGIYKGEGKYSNTMGGVIVRLPNGLTTKVGSGFSDQERDIFFNNPKRIVGRTIEVLFKERTKSGRLRHPRYSRVRSDK